MPESVPSGTRVDTAGAGAYTNLSQQTLAKLRVYGGGPKYIKAGRRVIYDTRDLDSWMESRKRGLTSEPGPA